MEFDTELRKLSDKFYDMYPKKRFPDILRKSNRSYNVVLIDAHYDFFICVPYRSDISHQYAYRFKNSVRSRQSNSGLDYTKICIIKKAEFISDEPAIVDKDEYVETTANLRQIVREACDYVDEYIAHASGLRPIGKKKYRKKYWYSSLKYFHKELGIS